MKDEINNNYIKNENPYNKYKGIIHNDVLKLYYQYNHLKNIYRQGWLTSLIGMDYKDKAESIADHSWSVTMLAISVIEKYDLAYNIEKCMKLSLVHELGEIYAGDFIPNSISKEEKHKLESDAVDKLFTNIEFENDFKQLWEEYENCLSKEAEFIKQIDKLECIIQASCYGLNSKYISGADKIKLPCLMEILDEVVEVSKNNKLPLFMRNGKV